MKNNPLEQFYKQYYNEVFLYALSLCNSYYVAESLTSDTFYKALLNINKLKGHAKYWLFRVCKNNYIDLLRRKKPAKINNSDCLTDNLSILDQLIKDEQNRKLYKAILQLKHPYKECILLYYYHKYTMKDIATLMKISNGSVRTIIYRARLKLKTYLKEENYEV